MSLPHLMLILMTLLQNLDILDCRLYPCYANQQEAQRLTSVKLEPWIIFRGKTWTSIHLPQTGNGDRAKPQSHPHPARWAMLTLTFLTVGQASTTDDDMPLSFYNVISLNNNKLQAVPALLTEICQGVCFLCWLPTGKQPLLCLS